MAEWTTDQIKARIRGEAVKQGVDPDLAVAVATQESYLNPNATGDNGNSLGLFQLQPAAAIDVGVNPQWRQEPGVNIYGGVSYLKQKLTQAQGNVEDALRRYNGGGDPNYVQNVMRFFKPGVAEASERPQAGTYTETDVHNALQALQGTHEPQAPAGGTYSDEDVQRALQALGGPQTPASATPAPPAAQPQPPAPPAAPPAASQGTPAPAPVATPADAATRLAQMRAGQAPALERFLALPSIAPLTPAERAQVQQEFQALPPDQQEQVIQMEVPGDLRQAMEKPPEAYPRGQGDTPRPGEKRLGAPDEPPLEEGITRPSTMIPLLLPGAGLKLIQGPLKTMAPLVSRVVRPVAEGLSQTAGWTAGRTAETGEVPSPTEIGKEAALNIATGGVVEIPGAVRDATRALLRRTPGAQILLKQQAVGEAEGLGKRVFAPEEKAVVSKVFDDVAATGEKLDVQPVRDYWKSLIPDERRIAARELKAINPRFAEAMLNPQCKGWDIGELQDLRSHLLKASSTRKNPATHDLLQGMRRSVDEAITQAMSKGSLGAEQLVQAQAAWRKVRQVEDLQGMVAKHTRESPNLKWQELNLAALSKDVHGGGSKAARKLMEGMSKTEREVLQQELDSLKRHYPFVRVNDTASRVIGGGSLLTAGGLALTGNLPGAAAALLPVIVTAASRSPTVMSLFKRSIIEGKGRLQPHHVDALMNAIRHENEGEMPAQ